MSPVKLCTYDFDYIRDHIEVLHSNWTRIANEHTIVDNSAAMDAVAMDAVDLAHLLSSIPEDALQKSPKLCETKHYFDESEKFVLSHSLAVLSEALTELKMVCGSASACHAA